MKFAPLCEVPMIFPPVGASHHLIIPFEVVALRLVEDPQGIDEGVAIGLVGSAGGVTLTVTGVLREL